MFSLLMHYFVPFKDQINSCPRSKNVVDHDRGSYDGASKKATTDAIKTETIGSVADEVHRSGDKIRRLSSGSMRDGRPPSVSKGVEQGNLDLRMG